jgi:hypothetical protein
VNKEEQLAWEQRNRPKAGLAAIAAAALTVLGAIVSGIALNAVPASEDRAQTIIDTLGRTAAGQANPPGRLSAQTLYLGDHATLPIVGAVLFGLGSLAFFPALAVLFRSTRLRRPQTPQLALVLLAVGSVAFAIGRTVSEVARYLGAAGFGGADRSNSAASDALGNSTSLAGQVVWQLGALILGFAFVLICVNAMRAGLLTRFMGVLGIIVGVTFVLPLDQQGIIRVFWLGALGVLLLGRWPRGMPPAWAAGEAVPWPTQQQIREERQAQTVGEQRAEPVAPAPRAPEPRAQAASKKKKRKRRD